MFGIDTAIIAALASAAVSAGASAYNTHQTNSANAAMAAASNSHDLGTFREANDFNRAQADLNRWFNHDEAALARDFSAQQTSAAQAFNSGEAQKNRDFQERMSNTQYQRAIGDMRAAGLNPMLAYSQGGAGNVGGATASSNAGAAPSASGSAASSAGAPRAHQYGFTGSPLASGVSSALAGAETLTRLQNMQKEGAVLEAQRDKIVSDTKVGQQREIELKKTNEYLTQTVETRLELAKGQRELQKIAWRIGDATEQLRIDIAKQHLSQEQIRTRLLAIDEQLNEAGVPKAKAEGEFFKKAGEAPYWLNLGQGAIGAVGSAAQAYRSMRAPGGIRSYNQTNYDRDGNISGGYSRNYGD